MSELTKVIAEMAIITLKNLSDALLQSASQISKLNHSPETFTQAKPKQEFVSSEAPELTKRDKYKVGDLVLVMFDGAILPTKFKILEALESGEYRAYAPREVKSSWRKISHDQILGLVPDR
jgi:hypothetical protein